jgi:hypothetical protein
LYYQSRLEKSLLEAHAASAMAWWMDSTPHRSNILHPLYREMGIGIAPISTGGFVYVVDFGAQPNVLPIFINNDATQVPTPDVKITLSDELVTPTGEGNETLGHPTEVQISNSNEFGFKWQPFASAINWTLVSGNGTKTVYVRYRDAKGRMTISVDSIMLNAPSTPTLTETPVPSPTRQSTRALISSPSPASTTATPTETIVPASTIVTTTAQPITTSAIVAKPTIAIAMDSPLAPSGAEQVDEHAHAPDFAILGAASSLLMLLIFAFVKYLANRWPLP